MKNQCSEQKAQLLEIVINAVEDKTISSTIAGNVKEVLETFAFDQIFGRKEIKSALHYGDYRAGSTIEIMHQLEAYRACEGAWKGQIQNKMTVQFK